MERTVKEVSVYKNSQPTAILKGWLLTTYLLNPRIP